MTLFERVVFMIDLDHEYLFQNIYLIPANQKFDIGSSILMAIPSKSGIFTNKSPKGVRSIMNTTLS
jgi:hypothetical protein